LRIEGSNRLELSNVLVGEVWLCSGQSNMQWPVGKSMDGDLELLMAKNPQIRHLTIPLKGTQEPQAAFSGRWQMTHPSNMFWFPAVAYFFGEILHEVVDVPIGLIACSWGGSTAEAWVRRDLLEADSRYSGYMDHWREVEATYDHEAALEEYRKARVEAIAEGKKEPPKPRNPLEGQHRPGNLYNGMLKPVMGHTFRGVIWYQGEGNASRAAAYETLFPLLITSWREEWGMGDFPFYWVQLADFQKEVAAPRKHVPWAHLRDSQTATLSLPNTGQAVIYDVGEANDIHPINKQVVARRLARHALAKVYDVEVAFESPRYASHRIEEGRVQVQFNFCGGGLEAHDYHDVRGFALAGEDEVFHWAEAAITGTDTIEVWSDAVSEPLYVRYAWEVNPVANVVSKEGLLLTPFRTDKF
jgi:sialate O-acetylesterase